MSIDLSSLFARLLLSAIFVRSLWAKLANWEGSLQYMQANELPGGTFGEVLLAGAVLGLVSGSLSIVLGWKTLWGALGLIAYLVPVTLLFHLDLSDRMQWIQLTKNLSIAGGLLLLAGHGAGRYAIDHARGVPDAQEGEARSLPRTTV